MDGSHWCKVRDVAGDVVLVGWFVMLVVLCAMLVWHVVELGMNLQVSSDPQTFRPALWMRWAG